MKYYKGVLRKYWLEQENSYSYDLEFFSVGYRLKLLTTVTRPDENGTNELIEEQVNRDKGDAEEQAEATTKFPNQLDQIVSWTFSQNFRLVLDEIDANFSHFTTFQLGTFIASLTSTEYRKSWQGGGQEQSGGISPLSLQRRSTLKTNSRISKASSHTGKDRFTDGSRHERPMLPRGFFDVHVSMHW